MRIERALLLLVLAAACRRELTSAAAPVAPESDDVIVTIPAGTPAAGILPAVDEGLRTPEKGPELTRFIVIRAADRHPVQVQDKEFHVLVGAGVRMPAGTLRIRRKWIASGQIDGRNAELQTKGISVAVERGAARPFVAGVEQAVSEFCEALATRVPLHPDCVVAMEEVPYTFRHEAGEAELALARAARLRVRPPPADGALTITTAKGDVRVTFERRDTPDGITVGMMMRKGFEGRNRGMLFVYPQRAYRNFWMRNCFIEMDLAYILRGRIEQLVTMRPEAGTKPSEIPYYPSNAAVKYVLEMPGGWFARNGVRVGDAVALD